MAEGNRAGTSEALPIATLEYVVPTSFLGGDKMANILGRPALDFQGSYLKVWSSVPGVSFGQWKPRLRSSWAGASDVRASGGDRNDIVRRRKAVSGFTHRAGRRGSMVGSGIFALPAAFGRATGGLGALIAWAIAGFGMLMLAFVFQTLSRRKPHLDSGIFAYAKAGFGNYLGFASALGYWAGCCLADVACLVLIKATLGGFWPIFGDGATSDGNCRCLGDYLGRPLPDSARSEGGGRAQHDRDLRQDRAHRALHRLRRRRLSKRNIRVELFGRRRP